MSYRTIEVELDNGRVRPVGPEALPARAQALLTLLDAPTPGAASDCGQLADRWERLEKLSPDEASAFADDLENSRACLPPLKSAWE